MAETQAPTPQIIQGYGAGMFRISAIVHQNSVIVFPTQTILWPVTELGQVDESSLSPALGQAPELDILLLGTGNTMKLADPTLIRACRAHSVVLEVMDTGAACRTYNLLAGEQRRIAAALIALI